MGQKGDTSEGKEQTTTLLILSSNRSNTKINDGFAAIDSVQEISAFLTSSSLAAASSGKALAALTA